MPALRDLYCSIELSPSNSPLCEHGTSYHDGFVQTFVAVPTEPAKFSVHLTSRGYIAPGLGMFVFIDSIYQCNRIRRGLQIPNGRQPIHETNVDFRVRQKEEKIGKDVFIGRDWTFAALQKISHHSDASANDRFTRNVGAIEVVVLRCFAREDVPAPLSTVPHLVHAKSEAEAPIHNTTESKRPRAPSKQSSAKAESALGDLTGLFDGANDTAGQAPSELVDATRPQIKRYWASWRKNEKAATGSEQAYVMPEEPLRAIPEVLAQDRSHQLRSGRGALYSHRTGSAKYMDTIEKPYAVFWFGYRSKESIEKRFNIKIEGDAVDFRQQMMHKTKEDLVEELIKAKTVVQPQAADNAGAAVAGSEQGDMSKQNHGGKASTDAAARGSEQANANANTNQDQTQAEQQADKKSATGQRDGEQKKKKSTTSKNDDTEHHTKEASQHPSAAKADAEPGKNETEEIEWGKTEAKPAEWGDNKADDHQNGAWGSNKGSKKSRSVGGPDFIKVGSTKGALDWEKQPEAGDWAQMGPVPEKQGWS